MKTIRSELCYVKDSYGICWLTDTPPNKLVKNAVTWFSGDTDKEYNWYKVIDGDTVICKTDNPLQYVDLTNIPEPNWEDRDPMIIAITMEISTSYYY